jgi:hypothetical protein
MYPGCAVLSPGCQIEVRARHESLGDEVEFFGPEVIRRLLDGTRPGWESDLRQTRERHLHLCHCHAACGLGQDAASPTRS